MIRETLPGHIKHPSACASGASWRDNNQVFMGYIRLLRLERGKRLMQILGIKL